MTKKTPTRKVKPGRRTAQGDAPPAGTAAAGAATPARARTRPERAAAPAPAPTPEGKATPRPAAATKTAKSRQPNASVVKAAPKAKAAAKPKRKAATRVRARKRDTMRHAKFAVGQVVKHRFYPFRGVIFDIDPVFNNTEEWWTSIPEEIRPAKDQPFYHLLAENAETEYVAYVSEQNLLPDDNNEPLRHPKIGELFTEDEDGQYRAIFLQAH